MNKSKHFNRQDFKNHFLIAESEVADQLDCDIGLWTSSEKKTQVANPPLAVHHSIRYTIIPKSVRFQEF
jgi:hypothetical protein